MDLKTVERTTLTMKEAAEYLGISYWLANQLVRRKQIPCSKIGGKFLFRVQALDEYLTKKEKDQMKWVGAMNMIAYSAREMVLGKCINTYNI